MPRVCACARSQSSEKFNTELEKAFQKSAFTDSYLIDEASSLGTGACGVVKAGTHRATGGRVAIKMPKHADSMPDSEIDFMRQCQDCTHIIRCAATWHAALALVADLRRLAQLHGRVHGDGRGRPPQACVRRNMTR